MITSRQELTSESNTRQELITCFNELLQVITTSPELPCETSLQLETTLYRISTLIENS